MRESVIAAIALGANLGAAAQQVRGAMQSLGTLAEVSTIAESGLYSSPAFQSHGPDYVNAVMLVNTTLTAPALWQAMCGIEAQFGRERPYRWAPRTLDLDLIFYGSAHLSGPHLTVPHPRWTERAFVVVPLTEIAPHLVPQEVAAAVIGQPIERLMAQASS